MIKKYRLLRGLTQEELAEKLNISWRQVQRIENNMCTPSLKTFKKLIKILNISDKDVLDYLKQEKN